MWKVVESCMKDATLQALRDGKLRSSTDPPLRTPAATKTSRPKVSKKQQEVNKIEHSGKRAVEGGEDESDGGFFEE